jgi:hypothetical protein
VLLKSIDKFADGRDFLPYLVEEWKPTYTVYQIIQKIPELDFEGLRPIFHLGALYEMMVWHTQPSCSVYPCQEFTTRLENGFVVVTPENLLVLRSD